MTDEQIQQAIRGVEERLKQCVTEALAELRAQLAGESPGPAGETEGERLFRTRNGPFLNAVDRAGGEVSPADLVAMGARYGFSGKGLGGFFAGKNPSLRVEGDRRVLTPRGRAEAARWRKLHGDSDAPASGGIGEEA